MLVLTRRPGEQIVIGDGIRVTVVSVGPGRVKIGIDAPANVRIDRQEIHARIQQENEHGSDVLAAVGQGVVGDEASPTLVALGAASETATDHPRPATPLPFAEEVGAAAGNGPVSLPFNRPTRSRLPRKPR